MDCRDKPGNDDGGGSVVWVVTQVSYLTSSVTGNDTGMGFVKCDAADGLRLATGLRDY